MKSKVVALALLLVSPLLLSSCGDADTKLVVIQQQETGNYVVSLLGVSTELEQSSNRLALEIRETSTHELTSVNNLQVQATMSMAGMAPMFGDVSGPNETGPGRYELEADLTMVGGWSLVITFDPEERVQFSVNAY